MESKRQTTMSKQQFRNLRDTVIAFVLLATYWLTIIGLSHLGLAFIRP